MSRETIYIGDHIIINYGLDHALGYFLDISDTRTITVSNDEGIVYEWSIVFGCTRNYIAIEKTATIKDVKKACDEYADSLEQLKREEQWNKRM